MRKLLIAAVGAILITGSGAGVAHAEDSELQARVDAILAAHPGGVQTAPNEIEWDDGDVTLTLDMPGVATPFAVGSCATDRFCAYGSVNLSGTKLTFSTCDATHSTAALGTVRSMANARSSGTVQGLSSSGSVLTSLGAGGRVNSAPAGITQVKCIS
ncbi:MAG: peptidase inhibitor family I36 protein [Propionibacteriaceae bacterium]|nr:peptidase inhibitor family I36 protein [Propionibacteriaceae bacterium]